MKITICGSITFIEEMNAAKEKLQALGHHVEMPPLEIPDNTGKMIPVKLYWEIRKSANENEVWVWDRKAEAIRNHFEKIVWANGILILNLDKNGVSNYIGANTFLEMGLAFHYKKPIYLLNPIPEISYKEEILGMKPIAINGDFALIA